MSDARKLLRAAHSFVDDKTLWEAIRAYLAAPADDENERLRAALRRHAMDRRICNECKAYWGDGPERHVDGCLCILPERDAMNWTRKVCPSQPDDAMIQAGIDADREYSSSDIPPDVRICWIWHRMWQVAPAEQPERTP